MKIAGKERFVRKNVNYQSRWSERVGHRSGPNVLCVGYTSPFAFFCGGNLFQEIYGTIAYRTNNQREHRLYRNNVTANVWWTKVNITAFDYKAFLYLYGLPPCKPC